MEDMVIKKGSEKSRSIFPLEFDCQAPLKSMSIVRTVLDLVMTVTT